MRRTDHAVRGNMGCTLQPATQTEEKDTTVAQNGGREMDDTATAVSGLPFKGATALDPTPQRRVVRCPFLSRSPLLSHARLSSLLAQKPRRRTSLKRSSLRI